MDKYIQGDNINIKYGLNVNQNKSRVFLWHGGEEMIQGRVTGLYMMIYFFERKKNLKEM